MKDFSSLMLDIRNNPDEDKLFNFILGLQEWAQSELRRQGVVTYRLRWLQQTSWWTIRWATPSTPCTSPKQIWVKSSRRKENLLSLRRLVGKELT